MFIVIGYSNGCKVMLGKEAMFPERPPKCEPAQPTV